MIPSTYATMSVIRIEPDDLPHAPHTDVLHISTDARYHLGSIFHYADRPIWYANCVRHGHSSQHTNLAAAVRAILDANNPIPDALLRRDN